MSQHTDGRMEDHIALADAELGDVTMERSLVESYMANYPWDTDPVWLQGRAVFTQLVLSSQKAELEDPHNKKTLQRTCDPIIAEQLTKTYYIQRYVMPRGGFGEISPSSESEEAPSPTLSLPQIMDLLAKGKPVPGVRMIPDHITHDPRCASASGMQPPRKPWELEP